MASDAARLQAERLYIESEAPQSDLGIARACSIDRGTVKRWREAGQWEMARTAFWHRCRTDAAVATQVAADTARAAHRYLTHAQRLEILHDIATDRDAERRDRIAAVLACNKLDPPPPPESDTATRGTGGGMTIVPSHSSDWRDEAEHGRA